MRSILFVCLLAAVVVGATLMPSSSMHATAIQNAHELSPLGKWETLDDATGKVTSVVLIWKESGMLYGSIEELAARDPLDPNPLCTRCDGAMKDKPLIGLRILWGLRRSGERWLGGQIVDPDNGKTYRCEMTVEDSGNKLKVRGYIGFSFIGRTEHWLREGRAPRIPRPQ